MAIVIHPEYNLPMNILIVSASKEGQTDKIADFIAEKIRQHGHQTTTLYCKQIPADFQTDPFDAAILGGSIHVNKYPGELIRFIKAHQDWLNRVPTALFTVCMAIRSKHENEQQQALAFGEAFSSHYNWHPNLLETFAGAIKYTQYGFITRKIMQYIAKKEGGNTDTTQDHEYTKWDEVARFAEKCLTQFEVAKG